MEYEIDLGGVLYVVEPYVDVDELFAVIRSVSGLEEYSPDELPELFSDKVHRRLARKLEKLMKEEGEELEDMMRAEEGEV